MQVIKEGRKQTGWASEYKCTGAGNKNGGCGATLLVEKGDLYQTSRSDYAGDTDYYVTFACGACGVETDIKDSPFYGKQLRRK